MSKVLQGFNSLGQVAVELGHAGREEGVNHRAREEAAQVCLEEAEHLGFVRLSGNKADQTHTDQKQTAQELHQIWHKHSREIRNKLT